MRFDVGEGNNGTRLNDHRVVLERNQESSDQVFGEPILLEDLGAPEDRFDFRKHLARSDQNKLTPAPCLQNFKGMAAREDRAADEDVAVNDDLEHAFPAAVGSRL